jgi:CheY-like chemotaxis protein
MARVLVVDDRAPNRDLLAYLLTYFGHEVVVATGGAEAARLASADPPDLVIMDIAMPRMDGLSAVHAMRAEPALSATPMIAVSATSFATLDLAREAGFDGFFPLPIDPATFVALLGSFLAAPTGPAGA